ncbi:MAG: nuclear transport factor 2 family protein [Blastomonas sp.]
MADVMVPKETQGDLAEAGARRALTGFYRAMDCGDMDAMLACCHPEMVWERRGEVLRGADDFRRAQASKSSTLLAHHLILNFTAQASSADRADFETLVLAIRSDSGEAPAMPQSPGYMSMHRCTGTAICDDDGQWRLIHYRPETPDMDAGTIGPTQFFAWPGQAG